MADDILGSVVFFIIAFIIGAVMIVLGFAFHSILLVVVGGFFSGGIAVLRLVMLILESR